ncbi:MAG TPA: M14 family metallopeptidase [Thermoanaerobaculia bacterium]|nr:M14 family metallopeptidase [Thermoanaerobaculia bacterium]
MLHAAVLAAAILAQSFDVLPPAIPWSGRSRELAVPANNPWITPSETSNFRFSPSYDETVAWLKKLDAAAPELQMVSIGRSAEGREIWMVIASKERAFTPEGLRRSRKPTVLAQGGIHSGEIDGKDAGMMLLRDMTVGTRHRALLDRANFLFVPILSVDAHERASPYGRINQRGPEVMGWRTNARNLNLNRDYAKLDTEEVRSVVAAISRWSPDLYIDLHVTDGSDYQYDITYGWNTTTGRSPSIVQWLNSTLEPALARDLTAMGHIPGPLVFPIGSGDDPADGLSLGNADPRLSTGYGDARQLPTMLVENHSLKPYDQRVLGTYVLLATTLDTVGRTGENLRRAIDEDRRRRIDPMPLEWEAASSGKPVRSMAFKGVESRLVLSPVSGAVRREWLGKPVTFTTNVYEETVVKLSASRPKAYWIPAAWHEVADRLRMHGIVLEQINAPREVEVEMYRLVDPKLATTQFEGHVRIDSLNVKSETKKQRFPAGSWRVSMDQPLGTLAGVLLEPMSADSLLQWGFFHSILQRTEYAEAYVLEPLAEKMLAADPKLAAEFQKKLATDEAFRASSDARLRWFYSRTPFWDDRWLLYPVAREK